MKPCKECGQELEKDRSMVCHRCAPEPRGITVCNYWKLPADGKNKFKEYLSWLKMIKP